MRKIVIASILLGFGVNAFALTQERRIELLESAVVKLIKENQKLKNEINNLNSADNLNSQMIIRLNNRINNKTEKQKNNLYAKITAFELNVREKPSVNSRVIAKLKRGDLVKIKGAFLNKDTIWYKIDNGYISSKFTTLVYGDKIEKEKIPALRYVLPKVAKTKPKEKKLIKPTKVKLINIPPKPKEKENNATN